ncbi:MetQ/NlpA family ABC transporter substrate-binding protein [Comamonas humi]
MTRHIRIPRRTAVLAAAALLALAGIAPLAQAADRIRIASTPGATSDAIKAAIGDARAQGLDVELVEFTDWTVPNEALNNGDVDLNFFQHQPFLNNAIKERGYKLQFIGYGLLQNIGIYSDRHASLSQVPDKAKVAIASDPVNQGRGLLLLQQAGFIKLRTGNAPGASLADVSDNPRQLRFYEVEGPQLIRSLPDVDLAVLWPSYFAAAGRKAQASQGLLYSGIADRFYAMGFVAQAARANDPKLRKFVEVFQNSGTVRQAISQQFNNDPKLYTLPWLGAQ